MESGGSDGSDASGESPALLSPNGFKSRVWGPQVMWPVYHGWSAENWLRDCGVNELVLFFLYSVGFTLPCVYCRHSSLDFLSEPGLAASRFLHDDRASRGSRASGPHRLQDLQVALHNCVNQKLGRPRWPRGRPPPDLDWRARFWDWLFLLALDYPLNVSLEVREVDRDVSRRYRTYVYFFDLLKDLIPDAAWRKRWTSAFLDHPPTPTTFASRSALVRWLYEAMYCRMDPAPVPFAALMERYGPMRASSCTAHSRPGEAKSCE